MTYHWTAHLDAAWPRFVAKLDTSRGPDACWLWTGAGSHGQGNTADYGSFKLAGQGLRAHIVMAVYAGVHVPGLTIDHRCDVPRCCNPAHFENVTRRENSLRRWARARGCS